MTKKQCRSRGTACPSPADGAVNAVHLETMLDSSILPVVGRNLPWLQLQVAASACEVTWLCYIFVGSFSPNHCDWVEAVSTSFVHILGRKEEQRLWHPCLFLLRRAESRCPVWLCCSSGPALPVSHLHLLSLQHESAPRCLDRTDRCERVQESPPLKPDLPLLPQSCHSR